MGGKQFYNVRRIDNNQQPFYSLVNDDYRRLGKCTESEKQQVVSLPYIPE